MLQSTNSNSTTSVGTEITSYICLFVSSVFFGGNYLPVKHYETGDGVFFQLIVCIAIWSSGMIVHAIKKFPKFYALPVLGGFIWTTGNVNSVPVIKCLGIGLGSLFWNIVGLLIGWANARFGWFGVKPEIPSNIFLNYLGVSFCVGSIVMFLFVDTEIEHESKQTELLINPDLKENQKLDYFDRLNSKTKKVLGTLLSMFTGVMFGLSLTPILYLEDNYNNVSHDYNDYAFSYNTGIILGSIFYFIIYCLLKKNKPDLYPKAILPGFITGWLWLIANTCFFIATNNLSQVITFPVVNCGPCSVAFIIALIYKEIKGRKNFILVFCGILSTLIGSVLCSISK